ncbi:hypothetical protein WMF37_38205 [Sorangium sp. So ce291]|uniref:hypothetical protein n=1 Tax=Sorangium sp. So ce291 TaxID=3133294 RepID=UPI003F5E3B4E
MTSSQERHTLDFPALPGIPSTDRERLRSRFAGWDDSYLACTGAPTIARDEILDAVRARGGDVPPAPEACGSFRWYEGSVLVTESRDTWCLYARSAEQLVPWLRAFGERRPRKPIWFPACSAVLAESEPLEGEGLLFEDREPSVEGFFLVRNGSAVVRYRLPGGGMSQGLDKRATARLHAPWQSSFDGVPTVPAFVVIDDEGCPAFLAWLHAQGPSSCLVDAVSDALGIGRGIRQFDRTAMCGPVLCHAEFFAGAASAQAFESPLLRSGDPWLPAGESSRLLVGYWDIGTSDAFLYLGEDRRIYRYTFEDALWSVSASSYAAYVERILRFDATIAATHASDLPIIELCERLGLVVDPIGTDDWATLAVSNDLAAFQRPGERAFLKCFTPQAQARARALLSG